MPSGISIFYFSLDFQLEPCTILLVKIDVKMQEAM